MTCKVYGEPTQSLVIAGRVANTLAVSRIL